MGIVNRSCCRIATKLLLTTILLSLAGSSCASELILAVANSTCAAIKKMGHLYEQPRDIKLNYICKSSGRLAKGLKGGAIKADIYISANHKWMGYLIDASMVSSGRVVSPWSNELVVAVPKTSPIKNIAWGDLASDKIKTILIGDPGTAPFGRYAKEAMQSTNLWERVRKKITTKKHITLLAHALAESDGSTLGVLFRSNVNSKLSVVHTINKSWHSPIRYYMAPMKSSSNHDQVSSLLEFIQSDEVREIFTKEGFIFETP